MIRLVSLAAAVVLTVGTTVASAAPITFFNIDDPRGTFPNSLAAEAQFRAALSVFGTEDVEALSGINPTLTFGATGVTASAGNTLTEFNPAIAVSGSQILGDLFGDEVFTFNQPVQGFSTFLIDLGDTGGAANTLTFKLENIALGTSQIVSVATFGPNLSHNNVAYFGVVDLASPFNRVTVHATNDSDGFFYDNLTAGFASGTATAVPEPGSLALLVTGAVGFFARRRQRR